VGRPALYLGNSISLATRAISTPWANGRSAGVGAVTTGLK
jgi:hypothetical protein